MSLLKSFFSKPSVYLFICLFSGLFILFPDVFNGKFEAIGPMDLVYHYAPFKSQEDVKCKPGSYILSDQMDQTIPEVGYLKEKISQGVLPSYSDRIQNGAPFFWVIRHEAKVLPLLILLFLFSVPTAITIFWVLRLLVGGYFFYKFLSNKSVSSVASIFGAVVFSFSSYIIQNFGITMAYQYILIPVGLYGIDQVFDKKSNLWTVLLPVIFFQVLVAGYPTTAAYIASIYLLYFVFRFCTSKVTTKTDIFLRFSVIGVSTLLLTALSIFATHDFFSDFDWSYRNDYSKYVLQKTQLITLFFPFYNGTAHNSSWIREGLYIGILPLLLSIYWILDLKNILKNKIQIFFLFLGVVVFCFAYDFLFFNKLYQKIPVFNSSMPNNLIMLLPVVFAIWSVFGLNLISERPSKFKQLLTLFLVASLFYWFFSYHVEKNPDLDKIIRDTKSQNLFYIFWISICVWFVAVFCKKNQIKYFCMLAVIITLVDLCVHGLNWNRTLPKESFMPLTKGISFIKKNLGDGKIFLINTAFFPNLPLYYDIPTVAGRGFYTKNSKELYRLIDKQAFPPELPTLYLFEGSDKTNLLNPITDAIGIKYLISDNLFDISDLSKKHLKKISESNVVYELQPDKKIIQNIYFSGLSSISNLDIFSVKSVDNINANFTLEIKNDQKKLIHKQSFNLNNNQNSINIKFDKDLNLVGETYLEIHNESNSTILLGGIHTSSRDQFLKTQHDDKTFSKDNCNLNNNQANQIKNSTNELAHNASIINVRDKQESQLNRHLIGFVGSDPIGRLYIDEKIVWGGSLSMAIYKNMEFENELSAKFVKVFSDDMTIWENKNYIGRAWGVRKCVQMEANQIYEKMKAGTIDFFSKVYIDLYDSVCKMNNHQGDSFVKINSEYLSETEQIFNFESESSFYLIIGDNYDKGWKAYSGQGKELKLIKANFNLRAVYVPNGVRSVRLKYEPYYFKTGYAFMVLGLIFPFIFIFLNLLRKIKWGKRKC